jgi:hypothetical protein
MQRADPKQLKEVVAGESGHLQTAIFQSVLPVLHWSITAIS